MNTAAPDEEPWVAGYRAAMTQFVLKHGTLVDPTANSYYGWIAEDYDHPRTCVLTLAEGGTFHENTVTEFQSTFEGNRESAVVDAFPVSCACGAITNRTVRYEGTVGHLLTNLLSGLSNLT